MSNDNHERRIAALESLVSRMAQTSKVFAKAYIDLSKRLLETDDHLLLTLRLILAAGIIDNETVRRNLTDEIAKVESEKDQIAAHLREIQAGSN